nr:hypothetical protein [Lacticaseibacillus manihotivorans]
MRQRLLVAVALIGDHPIVIFDEPTNALDEDGQQFMITLIKDLQARGKTVLVSSHDAAFLKAVSDEIFYFSDGQIVRTERVMPTKRSLVIICAIIGVSAHCVGISIKSRCCIKALLSTPATWRCTNRLP